MKKEIIINASKDRSRIAIVEDGELVELYVENPDNVRTIGNIYLGGVQKVMPAIRAAFVNVGQKQDAFLHFSDLTDNAAQLFALAGEDVPGLEAPVLSQAPPKRVGDDESEPDPEETLEIESGDDEDDKPVSRTRSRSRRRSRGRGRGRGRNQKEEEEEQEEGKKGLPSVIDLTSPAPKRSPRKPKTEDASPKADAPGADDRGSGSDDDEAPKRSRRSRSRKADTGDDPPSNTDEKPREETREDKPKRSRRSRSKKSDADTPAEDTGSSDAEASDPTPSERPKRTRRRSRSSDASSSETDGSTGDSDAPKPTASEKETPDATAEEKPASRGRKPRRSNTIDLTSPAPSRSRSASSDGESSKDDDDAPRGRAGDSDDSEGSSSRRRSRRGRSSDASDDSASDASKSSDRSRRGRASDSDDGEDSGRSRRGRRTRSDDDTSDDQRESDARGGSDDASSKDDSGRSRRGRRSRSDDASSKGDESSSRDDGDSNRSGRGSGRSKDSGARDSGRRDSGRSGSGRGGRSGRGGSQRGGGSNANVPSAESLLKRGTRVICKITKEPISTKGPRVSTDISLAGRFLVLVPAADYIAVSKKIESAKERRRLRTLASSLKPDGFGVIVRTVASGRDAKSLDTDLRLLIEKWNKIQRKLDEQPEPPVLLYEDVNMVSSIIRDLFSEDYDRIVVDDPRVHRNVQAYVKAVAPQMLDKVELHRKNQPVYRSYGIERQVEEAFSRRVNMKGGGYLFIETTEAMHVVDVNSGRAGRGKSQKENLIAVNVEAAREIAKQLRLRDLGGIIVVDFIDLRYDRDRRKVTDALKEAFEKDRAVTKLLPMSDFGLVQITRQRLRPSITTQTDDDADGADAARAAGAAEIRQPDREYAPEPEPAPAPAVSSAPERAAVDPEQATPEALTQAVRGWLDRYRSQVDEKYKSRPIVVRVHPLLGAYLRRGFPTPLTRWKLTLRGISFRVEDDASIDPLGFDARDEKSGRSLLSKYSS